MDAQDWLGVVRTEYLGDFIREGGAAVKFAVSQTPEGRRTLIDGLRDAAGESGFEFVLADAATTRLHLIDGLFHEVARQVDWDTLAYSFLVGLLGERGWKLPATQEEFKLPIIAELNDYEEPLLRNEVSRLVGHRILRDYDMCREFRLAMIWLCDAQLNPSDNPALKNAIKEWLRGELRRVLALRRALIFQKIARPNARHMLFSLSHWLKLAGRSGLVLVLDIARYAENVPRAAREDGIYYTTSAAIDLYEVLREFIDATDQLEFCFVGVLAGPEFLNDERRGLTRHQALRLRIWDEVRDRHRPNPRSSLVRLEVSG
jgi:hypothetical protein